MDVLFGLFIILGFHYIGDFLLQNKWMRLHKSTDLKALLTHVLIYGLTLLPFIYIVSFEWVIVNTLIHGLIDFVTSKISHYYFDKGDNWAGMNIVGVDQLLHVTTLITTLTLYI